MSTKSKTAYRFYSHPTRAIFINSLYLRINLPGWHNLVLRRIGNPVSFGISGFKTAFSLLEKEKTWEKRKLLFR